MRPHEGPHTSVGDAEAGGDLVEGQKDVVSRTERALTAFIATGSSFKGARCTWVLVALAAERVSKESMTSVRRLPQTHPVGV
ncbi:hypothetical protein ACIOJD_30135 [Streptomyces sp. NPDC088116]|uniref:hypothetical protein n=1 Tax=Streptomyces sp. NPDC088116 TaxID=3365825 RepID=UPI0038309BF8